MALRASRVVTYSLSLLIYQIVSFSLIAMFKAKPLYDVVSLKVYEQLLYSLKLSSLATAHGGATFEEYLVCILTTTSIDKVSHDSIGTQMY